MVVDPERSILGSDQTDLRRVRVDPTSAPSGDSALTDYATSIIARSDCMCASVAQVCTSSRLICQFTLLHVMCYMAVGMMTWQPVHDNAATAHNTAGQPLCS